jgi:hypothetical protein
MQKATSPEAELVSLVSGTAQTPEIRACLHQAPPEEGRRGSQFPGKVQQELIVISRDPHKKYIPILKHAFI